jgi:ABC-type transport system substrate-binding protein
MSAFRHPHAHRWLLMAAAAVLVLSGCGRPWNDPYPDDDPRAHVLYSSFSERPRNLDPAKSYSSNEYVFVAQVYAPPLQYHYLERPYRLEPLSAVEVPRPRFYDRAGKRLPDDAPAAQVAYSVYEVRIREGMRYAPHPALAVDADGRPLYHALNATEIQRIHTLADFPRRGTREVVAADFVHQIKRLANPRLQSPLYGKMSGYIVGLRALGERLREEVKTLPPDAMLDLERHTLEGVEVVDRYTYRIRIHGRYPQFVFWLAMPFFSPMPPEADRFYAQPGLARRNVTLDWYPVGSGPYMLIENDPNRRMTLVRNPHYWDERYPSAGAPGDRERGLLRDAGQRLPLIDRIVFSREREHIPFWNKFLQGWYDTSGIAADTFDQAVRLGTGGEMTVSEDMRRRGIELQTSVASTVFYLGFNWLDPVVGGPGGERARKLRHAISIAIDQEEFIAIFRNGRGVPAQGPLPPGLFGHREGEAGLNRHMYDWVDGAPRRKSIEVARRLLAEAGYPGGRDALTGQPLVVHLDTTGTGPGARSRIDWYVRQLARIDVQLVPRATDWNRFQEKLRKGNVQLFFLGWNADYPDPENFLFLLYGPESKAKFDGNNSANYSNPEYDRLFEQMKNMDNGPERQRIIDRMVEILRHDAPWGGGFHPVDFRLAHGWLLNRKPHTMANNEFKYLRIDTELRAARRAQWNTPVLWPLALLAALLVAAALPAWISYRRRERSRARAGAPRAPASGAAG